jgi:hypothetical protein
VSDKGKRPAGSSPPPGKPLGKTQAQKRLEAQRVMAAASGARAARRRRLMLTVGAPLAAVVVIAAIIVIVGVTRGSKSSTTHAPVALSTALQSQVTSVPAAVLDQVGIGAGVAKPSPANGPALTADGKPRVLYVGAEWCPYCAAERWALTVALSRFGTLTGLQSTYSSASDVYPSTPTLTFHTASYTSSVISLTATEIQDGNRKTLATLDAADNALFTSVGQGGFPFIDLGGKYVISGSSYEPGLLKGKTHDQIAQALSDPTSAIGKAIDGTANYITAAICASTANAPTAVCSSSGVRAAASALGS